MFDVDLQVHIFSINTDQTPLAQHWIAITGLSMQLAAAKEHHLIKYFFSPQHNYILNW